MRSRWISLFPSVQCESVVVAAPVSVGRLAFSDIDTECHLKVVQEVRVKITLWG